MKHKLIILIFTIVAVIFFFSCNKSPDIADIRAQIPAKNFDNYSFNSSIPIADRIDNNDEMVLDYLKNMDGDESYTYYQLTEEEKQLLEEYLKLLPEYYLEILEKKLLGIYFINDFLGSGLSDYSFTESGELYYILVLNPMIFEKSLSELFTYKDNTCFDTTNSDLKLKIDISDDFSGLLYILMHETSHIFDYEERITPYTEPHLKDLIPPKDISSHFTDKFWIDYYEMKDFLQVDYKEQIHFYNDDIEKKISGNEMIHVYRELQKTPFASLYSYFSWAEDFAEYVTLYHFTQNLDLNYKITIRENNKQIFEYEPFENDMILSRASLLNFIIID